MNQKHLLLGLIVAITLAFGAFVAFDIKSKHKSGSSNQERSTNWKWTDDWKNSGGSVPLAQTPVAPGPQITAPDYREALKKSAELGKPAFVFFSADWCEWCSKMKKETFEDAKVKQVMPNYILVIVDTDKDRTGAKKFEVEKLPSYVITNCNEDKLKFESGYKTGEELAEWLNNPSLYSQPKKEIKEVTPPDAEEDSEDESDEMPRREERRQRRDRRNQEMPPGGS